MLKRGSIPVSVLVILTLVVFAFALLAFSFATVSLMNDMKNSVTLVNDFNLRNDQKVFESGENKGLIVEIKEKNGWLGLGEERLQMSVQTVQ